jgi:hypothetical protein
MQAEQVKILIDVFSTGEGRGWEALKAFLVERQKLLSKNIGVTIRDIDQWNVENIRANGAIAEIDKIINGLENLKNDPSVIDQAI